MAIHFPKNPSKKLTGKNPFIKTNKPTNLGYGAEPSEELKEAVVLHQKGLTLEAERLYRKVLSKEPDNFNALHLLGVALCEQNKFAQAVEYITLATQINSKSPLFYSNLGVAYRGLKLNREALQAFNTALLLNPQYPEALNNRGLCYAESGQLDKALKDYQAAVQLDSNYAYAHNNLGLLYKEQHDWPAALASYDRAIALNQNYAEAHWNRSILNLLLGKYLEGFKEYEWRWKNKSSPIHLEHRSYSQPLWMGEELPGQTQTTSTIFIYSEQGLGDTLQFCRYLNALKHRFKKVIFQCPAPLTSLISNSFPDVLVLKPGEEVPGFDCYSPLMSLPLSLALLNANTTDVRSSTDEISMSKFKNTRIDSAEVFNFEATPYLSIPQKSAHKWANLLSEHINNVRGNDDLNRLKIGLLSRGNPNHPNDHLRSIELKKLLTALPETHDYVCLQKDITPDELNYLKQHVANAYSFAQRVGDFVDTAAICSNLDLIITVDTSVAHLCAALGYKTWLLLPYTPDWRWGIDQTFSPWYPSMTLYRQGANRSWDEVLLRVGNALNGR